MAQNKLSFYLIVGEGYYNILYLGVSGENAPSLGPKSSALFCQLTRGKAQLPVRPLCYDLPHLSAGATGDLYTLQLAIFRTTILGALTSKSA